MAVLSALFGDSKNKKKKQVSTKKEVDRKPLPKTLKKQETPTIPIFMKKKDQIPQEKAMRQSKQSKKLVDKGKENPVSVDKNNLCPIEQELAVMNTNSGGDFPKNTVASTPLVVEEESKINKEVIYDKLNMSVIQSEESEKTNIRKVFEIAGIFKALNISTNQIIRLCIQIKTTLGIKITNDFFATFLKYSNKEIPILHNLAVEAFLPNLSALKFAL